MTLEHHTATAFSTDDIAEDILILTMGENEKEKVQTEYGEDVNVYTLSEFIGEEGEIPNPYGQPLNVYGECLEKLTKAIDKLAEILNKEAASEE